MGEEATSAVGLVEEAICAVEVFEKKTTPKKNGQNAKARRRKKKKMPEGRKTTWVTF